MKRVISLFLPSWSTDRLRRTMGENAPSLDAPLILIGHEGRRRVVLAADQAARQQGLKAGMMASKAQALVRELIVMDADPGTDSAALKRLAQWMQRRYTPIVATDAPDGLMLDVTGVAHLFGGEKAMLQDIARRLAEVGIGSRISIAASYGAAYAFARTVANPTFACEPTKLAEALSLLPLGVLRLPMEIAFALKQLGFERIGELSATPRAPLALRFGSIISQRLDQAYGHISEPFDIITTPETPHVQRLFGEPIGAPETLARYTGKLVGDLSTILETKGLGARRLDLLFHRVDNRIEAVRISTARPLRDVKRLTRLLYDKIETIDPGYGVDKMTLIAMLAEPLQYRTSPSSLTDAATPDVSGLIDTLSNRIGDTQLYRVAPVESDIPERAIKRVPPLAPAVRTSWPAHWPRPPRLLSPPEVIETVALLPDNPPVTFQWRGKRRRVVRADGPERIFGEWWKSDAERKAVRDYFQVEDDAGERFWLFRAGDGEDQSTGSHRWFLHGIFS
jgi:protein ImuB